MRSERRGPYSVSAVVSSLPRDKLIEQTREELFKSDESVVLLYTINLALWFMSDVATL